MNLKGAWREEYGLRQILKAVLDIMRGNGHQSLHPSDTIIELRFGVFAILNIVSFALLGIYIPFLLAEGMQGEPIVRAIEKIQGLPPEFLSGTDPITDKGVLRRVSWDFQTCVTDRGVWNQTAYCVDLRNSLPPYSTEDMNLSLPAFADSPYRFLREKGDSKFKALRLIQNTSLLDVGVNTKPGGKKLLRELTCIPAYLDQFIIHDKGTGHFRLTIKDLLPTFHNSVWKDDLRYSYNLRDDLILMTSNGLGSGDGIRGMRPPLPKEERYQTAVDSALPWMNIKNSHGGVQGAVDLISGTQSSRQQNFLITFKPNWGPIEGLQAHNSSDDPIFGTAARELPAIACAKVFQLCSADRCTDPSTTRSDGILDLGTYYPKIMSVWLSTLLDNTYGLHPSRSFDLSGNSQLLGNLRHFFASGPNARQRWQDDVEERFIRSILRARHASKYGAEQDLVEPEWWKWTQNPNSLLYLNPDYTNINFWGFIATVCGYLFIVAASYWIALLSPITIPLKILAQVVSNGQEKVKDMFIFGSNWVPSANDAFRKLVRNKRAPPGSSNTLPMDTLHMSQENDEPDNPPKMAGSHGYGERS